MASNSVKLEATYLADICKAYELDFKYVCDLLARNRFVTLAKPGWTLMPLRMILNTAGATLKATDNPESLVLIV